MIHGPHREARPESLARPLPGSGRSGEVPHLRPQERRGSGSSRRSRRPRHAGSGSTRCPGRSRSGSGLRRGFPPARTYDRRPSPDSKPRSSVKYFQSGARRLSSVTNGEVRAWVGELLAAGYSPATARKAVFALRQMFDAAVADRRLSVNAAASIPLPPERSAEPQVLTREEVLAVADSIHPRYRAAVLLAGFGGLRYGELMGLRRKRIDTLRGRITVAETAVELGGSVTFGEPKTPKSKRTLPIPRTLMRALEEHLAEYVGADADALVFTVPSGGGSGHLCSLLAAGGPGRGPRRGPGA